ncbi:MAG: hypothetical protein Q8Q10_02130 [bacterium]|nr:hypothetical protein [bacterium]
MVISDVVYKLENAGLVGILTVPSIVELSDEVIFAIARLNQCIQKIHNLLTRRETLIASNYSDCVKIERRFTKFKENENGKSIEDFWKTFSEDEKELFMLSKTLYRLYEILHIENIGTIKSGALKEKYYIIYDEILKKEKELDCPYGTLAFAFNSALFLFISFFTLLIIDNYFRWFLPNISILLFTILFWWFLLYNKLLKY